MIDFSPVMTSEAANLLGVSAQTIRNLAKRGALPAIRTVGGIRLFNRRDVERLAQERREAPTGQPSGAAA